MDWVINDLCGDWCIVFKYSCQRRASFCGSVCTDAISVRFIRCDAAGVDLMFASSLTSSRVSRTKSRVVTRLVSGLRRRSFISFALDDERPIDRTTTNDSFSLLIRSLLLVAIVNGGLYPIHC